MDIETLCATIAVARSIPGSAAQRAENAVQLAEAAQESAEESAALAEQHSFGVSVSGSTLSFTKEDS